MARPYDLVIDFEFLKDEGISAVVSLTESPLHAPFLEEFGFEYKHVPVEDFSAPTMEQIESFVDFANRMLASGRKIVVHCAAGQGRTGTMLACYLVSKGYSAEKAIAEVRRMRPGSIETPEQESVISEFERRSSEK